MSGYGAILSGVFFFLLVFYYWASIGRVGVGRLQGRIPSCPLYYVIEVLNCHFNFGFQFEWHMESEGRSDWVAIIVPGRFIVA
jgi:hypothetical protein